MIAAVHPVGGVWPPLWSTFARASVSRDPRITSHGLAHTLASNRSRNWRYTASKYGSRGFFYFVTVRRMLVGLPRMRHLQRIFCVSTPVHRRVLQFGGMLTCAVSVPTASPPCTRVFARVATGTGCATPRTYQIISNFHPHPTAHPTHNPLNL